MTKVIILGQPESQEKPKKKIEFIRHISDSGLLNPGYEPSFFDKIMVVRRTCSLDVFICKKDGLPDEILYLGHFNDGIV